MSSPEQTRRRSTRRWWIAVAGVALLVVAAASAWYAFGRDHQTSADAAMAARGQQVMPFDLTRTTHTFTKTGNGGIERVVVNDPADTRDLTLIRAHLQKEAERFRSGDYADPAKIHGTNMPGVNELAAGAARVNVDYAVTTHGAQITYSSTEPGLISALHAWFDRQTSDHAMPGMGG